MFDFDVRDVEGAREPQTIAPPGLSHLAHDLADPIARIRRRPALVLPPTHTLADALRCFGESEHGMALVASYGYLLGTLTEKQLIRHLGEQPSAAPATAVWRVMLAGPETLRESDSAGYALQKLRQLGVTAMPILHASGRLLGLLDCRDLLNWVSARVGQRSCDFVGHG
jgi:CBS domain-containing protein